MAENEEIEGPTSRRNEWEAVYDDDKADSYEQDRAETSKAMFMSGHFVFPPSQHENLPLEEDAFEISKERKVEDVVSTLNFDEGEKSESITTNIYETPKPKHEEIYDGSELPCKAWWKRRACSLYGHGKETSAVWSIFIAAAVMGIVILGHRWQKERWQKMGKIMVPISRLKDVVVGGHRPGVFIRGSASGH